MSAPAAGARRRIAWTAAAVVWVAAPLALLLTSARHPDAGAALVATPPAATAPTVVFAPTFDEAARSFRGGRFADAYGRFVALADEGDRDAAAIALFMHGHGERLFGSAWDATDEQLASWSGYAAKAEGSTRARAWNAGLAKK